MKDQAKDILKKFWNYEDFRSPQEEVISSILKGKDTLALMPTGGGKSICYQVPALLFPGITIVVSPLIALMTDQVEQLKKRNIPAAFLISGMKHREIDQTLDNAVNGKYKLLYVSPERLKSELFLERLKRMDVSLLAVDEAHCISQWGFDFRPSYRAISELRSLLGHTPVLALTATATPRVADDIMDQLDFRAKKLIQKSFLRPELTYKVRHTERKWSETLQYLKNSAGSAIVYMRSRKQCVEVSKWLVQNGLSSTYYHAGLAADERHKRQTDWIEGKLRIMVCTNAFGMGVDKPDVRVVIHLEIPDSLEAYFQEAGRAGRDGKAAQSILLVGPSDQDELKRKYLNNFPDLSYIKRVYQAMANYLQLAVGSGALQSYDFDLPRFCKQYNFPPMKTHHALQIMEREGLIILSSRIGQSSRIKLNVDRTNLYDFQLRNPSMDFFIKTLMRSYGGLDTEYTAISEVVLGHRSKMGYSKAKQVLRHLHKQGILDYVEVNGTAQLSFLNGRLKVSDLRISDENLKNRYSERKERIHSVLFYINDEFTCRSRLLLRYFGEESEVECGQCDYCEKRGAEALSKKRFELISTHLIKELARNSENSIHEIIESLPFDKNQLFEVIDHMLDEGRLVRNEDRISLPN